MILGATKEVGGETKGGRKQNFSRVEDFPVCSLIGENIVLPVMYIMSSKPLNRDITELTDSKPVIVFDKCIFHMTNSKSI